jgi:hypothetical protein
MGLLRSIGVWAFKVWGNPVIRRGVPDIIACAGGKFVGIEVKSPAGGRLSPDQELELQRIRNAGGIAGVCRSLEDVLDLLEQAGYHVRGVPVKEFVQVGALWKDLSRGSTSRKPSSSSRSK